jgi:hypothetical protein
MKITWMHRVRLIDYKQKGHVAEYVGMDDFEGTECYKVKLTEKSGKIITYYIDPSNYFIIHSVTLTKANGQETESKTDFTNYQKLPEGIWLPMNIIGETPSKSRKQRLISRWMIIYLNLQQIKLSLNKLS